MKLKQLMSNLEFKMLFRNPLNSIVFARRDKTTVINKINVQILINSLNDLIKNEQAIEIAIQEMLKKNGNWLF